MRRSKLLSLVLVLLALATPATAGGTDVDPIVSPKVLASLAKLFAPPAQSITIPNTFTNGTIADAPQVNANFSALSSNALNRNGGTMLGTLNSRALTPTSDATYDVGTGALRYRDGFFSRNLAVGGTFAVTGAATFSSTTSLGGRVYTWPGSESAGAQLTTNGSGTLSWAAPSARGCDVRLTLTSGTPFTSTDIAGAANVYVTPYVRDGGGPAYCALYDGSSTWTNLPISELTLALGTLINGQGYDVFLYNNSGVAAVEGFEWNNAVVTMTIAAPGVVTWTSHGLTTGLTVVFTTTGALPTGVTANTVYYVTVVDANSFKLSTTLQNVSAGTFVTTSVGQSGVHTGHQPNARATAVVPQNGVQVKSGATTRRYVGSFLTSSTTTTEDSSTKRGVWSYYNRAPRYLIRQENTASWAWTTTSYRQVNGSASNQVETFTGLVEGELNLSAAMVVNGGGSTIVVGAAIGEDSTSVAATLMFGGSWQTATSGGSFGLGQLKKPTALGRHIYPWLEYGGAGVTQYGNGSSVLSTQATGIMGSVTQ